jgi:hypothetical protein
MCGTQSDGCGGTISCGGCAANQQCSSNWCVDPAAQCVKSGGVWDGGECVKCHTAACTCELHGGSWNGHTCL